MNIRANSKIRRQSVPTVTLHVLLAALLLTLLMGNPQTSATVAKPKLNNERKTAKPATSAGAANAVKTGNPKPAQKPKAVTTTTAAPKGATTRWMTADQRRRADQLVSIFEDSTTTIHYANAENLHDGRGVTAGRAGFTTGTCDALEVIKTYNATASESVFAPFMDELVRLCKDHSGETNRLNEPEYVKAWKVASEDQLFRRAQDRVLDRFYFVPAMQAADRLGLTSVLARAALYDAAIQHGTGDDPDGLMTLIARTNDRVGIPEVVYEPKWLYTFFDVRVEDLQDPSDEASRDAWRESVDRVACLRSIADKGNTSLKGPISCTVFGTKYTIA
jgi:chitosanase